MKRPNKLSASDQHDLVYLAGCALSGILADHCHVRQIKGLSCGQSVAEWASTLAIETHYRLKAKTGLYEKAAMAPVKTSLPKRMAVRTKLYCPLPTL
jgi:hypothetical protein